ncbi:hypothetical protein ACJ72_00022 [Emergomyces africanus]|uniref:Uncharacterized protein n=1 Tax=Emergomyces africanus TaxID=1955775 RepID=A0A1B7P9D9_9EURO|nr:hypothetical protein ACJ72_00022 [Emergomyces africanus]
MCAGSAADRASFVPSKRFYRQLWLAAAAAGRDKGLLEQPARWEFLSETKLAAENWSTTRRTAGTRYQAFCPAVSSYKGTTPGQRGFTVNDVWFLVELRLAMCFGAVAQVFSGSSNHDG